MTPEEAKKIQEKGLYYNGKVKEVQDLLRPYELEVERQHVDTVKDLAVISGAIAALSLTLFSAAIPKITIFLVSGVALLLINVGFIFWYLVFRITKSHRNILKTKEINLGPLQERVQDVFDAANGKMSYDQLLQREEGMLDKAFDDLSSPKEQSKAMSHYDEVALGILCVAIFCILCSFLVPLLQTAP